MTDDLVGKTVADGRYEIVRRLGHGGMGEVYLARQVAMDRMVALKLIRSEAVKSQEAATRFYREMKLTAKIEHPNTIRVYDFGQIDGQLFLTMELLRGKTLAEVIGESGRLPLDRIVRIGAQVARALQAAHSEGVVHRDLKPDNVMLQEQYGEHDVVKVLDFGVAKSLADDQPRMTATGAVVGTPMYISPEQAMGGAIDPRSDLYSLGIMLYEMVSGHVPFTAPSLTALLVAHATETPAPLATVVPDVHPGLAGLVDALLRKDPSARPQTARDVELHLMSFGGAHALPPAPPTSPGPPPRDPGPPPGAGATPPPPPKKKGGGKVMLWGIVVVLVIVGGVVAVAVTQGGGKTGPGPAGPTPTPPEHPKPAVVVDAAPAKPAASTDAAPAKAPPAAAADAAPAKAPPAATADAAPAKAPPAATADAAPTAKPADGDPGTIIRLGDAKKKLAAFGDPPPPGACAPDAQLAASDLVLEARQAIATDAARAAALAAQAIERCPSFAAAHNIHGNALQKSEKLDDAADAYARALTFAPDYESPRFNLGVMQLRRHDSAAIATFGEVIRRKPDNADAYKSRAQAYLYEKKYAEGLADLEAGLARAPDDGRAWLIVGQLRDKLKRPGARDAYCKAKELGVAEAKCGR
jgi:serine/threonine-protein kinase